MSGSFVLQAHAELERVLAVELAAIHEVVPRGWSPESQVSEKSVQRTADTFMAAALEPYSLILTARDPSGDIIGFHWLRIDKDAPEWAHIHSLWVAEARRNQGIGTALKREGEDWARRQGAKRLFTSVNVANTRMIAMNERLGFVAESVDMVKKL